ncbi:MAG: sodium-independent anion transporter [Flavobacteriia bacterium]|nr:MAG: sodium-independent anion transporter [Flavobacteriia bacterium]
MNKLFPFLNWLTLVKTTWKDDLLAGFTTSFIVLPQAIAFAMIAGLPPIYGFYTALVTPVIAALFGSSYHLVSGPTTASSIVVYTTLSHFVNPDNDLEAFITLAMVLSFLAGFFKLMMGILKMGKLVNFVSHSVIVGFTAGAGILIAFKQLRHVFSLNIPRGSSIIEIAGYIVKHIANINPWTVLIAVVTIGIAVVVQQYIKPLSKFYLLIAMVISTLLAWAIGGQSLGIETIGRVPASLPPFEIPDLSFDNVQRMSSGALVLALLGLIEAISISRSIALQSHQRIDTNQEFIGQGMANLVGSFFSSYAGSGSFSRSFLNYRLSAKTPMASVFSSIFLLITVFFFIEYASYLPMAAMAGIIILVGYRLIDFKRIRQIVKSSNKETVVLGITFLGTLFFELQFAVLAGVIASLYFYLERTSNPNIAVLGINEEHKFVNLIRAEGLKECSNLKVVRIDGSLYFAAIERIADFFDELYDNNEVQNILVVSRGINFIDLGAAEWLTHEVKRWQKNRGGIYFSGMKLIAQDVLKRGGFLQEMGTDIFYTNKTKAITEIHLKFNGPCTSKAFKECEG